MHPYIEKEIQSILNGSLEDMISKWIVLNEKYSKPSDRSGNIALNEYLEKPYMSLEDNITSLTFIGEKLFTREISLKKPHLIMDFMNQYWGYATPEQIGFFENTQLYKIAEAMNVYNSIIDGKLFPDSDPYFKYDPEHSLRLSLNYGLSQKLFTQSDIDKALENQDKTSESFMNNFERYARVYEEEHVPFGVCSDSDVKLKDYGCHIFLGKMNDTNSSSNAYTYIDLSYDSIFEIGANIGRVANHLWMAVRKNQKVLLTKSPGNRFNIFSPEEMYELYESYFSCEKHLQLPDPFLSQPR